MSADLSVDYSNNPEMHSLSKGAGWQDTPQKRQDKMFYHKMWQDHTKIDLSPHQCH